MGKGLQISKWLPMPMRRAVGQYVACIWKRTWQLEQRPICKTILRERGRELPQRAIEKGKGVYREKDAFTETEKVVIL